MKFIVEGWPREHFAELIREFEAWRKAHGIKGRPDAYALLGKKGLPAAHRKWLRAYVKRWEALI